MFVKPEQNLDLALKLWRGEPSGRLMFTTYFYGSTLKRWAQQTNRKDGADFLGNELGAMNYAEFFHPFEVKYPQVEVSRRTEGDLQITEHRSPWGTLRAEQKEDRILKHRVTTPDDLRTLIKIWESAEVTYLPHVTEKAIAAGKGRWPVVIWFTFSPLQHMIQLELSVEDFWYFMADQTALMEQAFEMYNEHVILPCYGLVEALPIDGFCQGENTSTTLISPSYYLKYSFNHVRDYAHIIHKRGKRLAVHMCGHLRDLMRYFPETGMDGIDTLTPPPVGNTDFKYAYEMMPKDFFCTGRFGSSLWLGKSKEEILANLAAVLPHEIYREHAFVLGVTGDGMDDIPLDDILRVRDCINEYERQG